MLGRLRMSVDEAIVKYAEFAERVFSEGTVPFARDERFSASKLEGAVKQIVSEYTGEAHERMLDTRSEGACKTYVLDDSLPNDEKLIKSQFRVCHACASHRSWNPQSLPHLSSA
jgi:hypothetical protein